MAVVLWQMDVDLVIVQEMPVEHFPIRQYQGRQQ